MFIRNLGRYPFVTGTSVIAIKYKDGILMVADMGGMAHDFAYLRHSSCYFDLALYLSIVRFNLTVYVYKFVLFSKASNGYLLVCNRT